MDKQKIIATFLLKLAKVFQILDISSEEKDKLHVELLESTMLLAISKVLQRNSSLASELQSANVSIDSEAGIKTIDEFIKVHLDEKKQIDFINEWQFLLNQYIESITPSLNESIKNQVLHIWA